MRSRRLARCLSIADLRAAARKRAPRMVFDYIDGGADDESTLRRNCDAFADYEGGERVVDYMLEGQIDRTLRVAAHQSTCVCFGVPDLDLLCVTSARIGLSDAALLSESNAGDLFLYRVGVHGLSGAENRP
jgi:sugar lactone lactonase YvrE